MKIFEDTAHYFRAADRFNRQGFDVLVLDYKAAYKAAKNPPKGGAGRKIAWVVGEAVAWARNGGMMRPQSTGALVAWSLGAEGLWQILGTSGEATRLGVRAAAAYYPSTDDEIAVRTTVPLLTLTGELDDVTEVGEIRKSLASADQSLITLRVYPAAHHGFDVESIPKPRTVSLIPLLGPSATFGYNRAAAEDSAQCVSEFLRDRILRP